MLELRRTLMFSSTCKTAKKINKYSSRLYLTTFLLVACMVPLAQHCNNVPTGPSNCALGSDNTAPPSSSNRISKITNIQIYAIQQSLHFTTFTIFTFLDRTHDRRRPYWSITLKANRIFSVHLFLDAFTSISKRPYDVISILKDMTKTF